MWIRETENESYVFSTTDRDSTGSKGIVKLYLSKLRGKDKNLKIFGTENDGKIILNYIPSKLIYEEEAIIYKILIIII